jgi:hypothetical protein
MVAEAEFRNGSRAMASIAPTLCVQDKYLMDFSNAPAFSGY